MSASPYPFSEVQEAVALALTLGYSDQVAAEVPQDVWDRLHEGGLVETGQDFTGDAQTLTTANGIRHLQAILAGRPKITHGRHCICSACAREDWSRITAPCGMHGNLCPARYQPLGPAGARS